MKSTIILGTLCGIASAICDHGTTFFPRSTDSVDLAKFGFNGVTGPLGWHALRAENKQCAVGKTQSPINIESANFTKVAGSSLTFDIDDYVHGAEILNLGTTVEVVANGTLVRSGKTYKLRQFHFHTPSEHRIDSEHYPAEVHFVFQSDEDQALSVVGFLIEIGNPWEGSCLLKDIFANIKKISEPGSSGHTDPLTFKGLQHHLASSEVYQYGGSLTTPPCTEGIAWNVVKEPLYIDPATYRSAKKVMKFNSRYTQNTPGQVNLLQYASDHLAN